MTALLMAILIVAGCDSSINQPTPTSTPIPRPTTTVTPSPSTTPTIIPSPTKTTTPLPWKEVSGVITNNQTWAGYVLITGDVYIPLGFTLRIEPGTIVHFSPNQDDTPHKDGFPLFNCPNPKSELIVDGELIAQGTDGHPIVFSSHAKSKMSGDWGGIIFYHNAKDVLVSNIIVEYADFNLLIFNNSIIENSVIRYAKGGFVRCPSANHWDVRIGIALFGDKPEVRNNEIYGNTWGIHSNQDNRRNVKDFQIIEGNKIFDNNLTDSGFDVPNGIHMFRANSKVSGNIFNNNTWGIEFKESQVAIEGNQFKNHRFGIVWYTEPGQDASRVQICNNAMIENDINYQKLPWGEPLPAEWLQCP